MKSSVYSSVSEAVMAARGAFGRYSELTLNERNEILEAVRTAVRPKIAELAEMTVAETGMGNVADKIEKLKLAVEKTPGIEDLITEVNTGDHGMTLYELSAFGVICAVHPCTNPCATLISNTIGMLAAGNSVVHCPHPRAVRVSQYLTDHQRCSKKYLRDRQSGCDSQRSLMGSTKEIMSHPDIDLIVCTGGAGSLRSGNVLREKGYWGRTCKSCSDRR